MVTYTFSMHCQKFDACAEKSLDIFLINIIAKFGNHFLRHQSVRKNQLKNICRQHPIFESHLTLK